MMEFLRKLLVNTHKDGLWHEYFPLLKAPSLVHSRRWTGSAWQYRARPETDEELLERQI